MAIIRMSADEAFSKPHEFSPEEKAILDSLTDEEIERRALADPDAQPMTQEMLEQAGRNRRRRLTMEALRDAGLGAKLTKAPPDLDLPLFELTDEHGRTVLLKATDCRRITRSHDPMARILKLEAIVPEQAAEPDEVRTAARTPEKQTT